MVHSSFDGFQSNEHIQEIKESLLFAIFHLQQAGRSWSHTVLLGVGDAHWVKCLPHMHEESRCSIDGVPVTLASGRQTHENTEGLLVSQSGLSMCYMINI